MPILHLAKAGATKTIYYLQSDWSSPFDSTSSAGFNISKMLILGFKPEKKNINKLLECDYVLEHL